MLRYLALVLDEAFGGSHNLGGEPQYLVERLAGGASRASSVVVTQLRQELEGAAKAAEQQSLELFGIVTGAVPLVVSSVGGDETTAMPADAPELPDGDGVQRNPAFGRRDPSRVPVG